MDLNWAALAGAMLAATMLSGACGKTVYVLNDCIATDPPDTGVWIWADGVEQVANNVPLARFYPDRAKRRNLQGEATLRCDGDSCTPLDQAISPVECQGPNCLERDGWVPDYGFAASAERAARQVGLVPASKPVTIRVAFRITGPGRGRQWACGETPPP